MHKVTMIFVIVSLFIPVGAATQAQVVWTKYEGNPILDVGSAGSWDDNFLLEPWVIVSEPLLKMWFDGNDGSNSRIGYAIADGDSAMNWTKVDSVNPVLDLGLANSWEDNHVAHASVLFDGSTYKMWYAGHDDIRWKIGLATSSDGIEWTKESTNPVLDIGSSGSWDDEDVLNPTVLLIDTTYFMWYTGNGGGNNQIGLATSSDGINWTRESSNPVMSVGPGWENNLIHSESVIHTDSLFQMWYLGLNSTFVGGTGYATSSDGVNWTKYVENPVLRDGADGTWDALAVAAGTVLFEHTIYHMWYDGSARSNLAGGAIGYATAPDSMPVVSITDEGVIPDAYELSQNYPNPFNPKTEIIFTIPKSENVLLVVYNLMGEKVETLLDEIKPSGSHTVEFDASNMASGVYFYKLQASDFVQTRKMVLLK